jgi:hypothetical protein
MIGKLFAFGVILLTVSLDADAALVNGNASSTSSLSIASYSQGTSSFNAIGLVNLLSSSEDIAGGNGSFSNKGSAIPCCVSLAIGDSIGLTQNIQTQLSGSPGFAGASSYFGTSLALQNTTSTLQTLQLDVFVDMTVDASDDFTHAQATGYAGYWLTVSTRNQNGEDSNPITLSADDIFVKSTDQMGPMTLSLLFDERLSFDVNPFETIGFTLFTSLSGSSLSPVPLPAALWLFGTALLGLAGFGRRRKAA